MTQAGDDPKRHQKATAQPGGRAAPAGGYSREEPFGQADNNEADRHTLVLQPPDLLTLS